MNNKEITTECYGRVHEHGEMEVTDKHGVEWNVEINAHLTVSSQEYEQLHEEIQKVIRRFAL
jgi:hypothetical protein